MKKIICAGNWKMNKTPHEAREYLLELKSQMTAGEAQQLAILAPALCLETVGRELKDSAVAFGGQNCHWQKSGAFTGENSPSVLAALGSKFCLVGHSERRQLFGETDDTVARKVKALQLEHLVPIFCFGETLTEREANQTESVVGRQLAAGLKDADPNQPIWLAYEPVWAIGTGRVATKDQVKETHEFIRGYLAEQLPALVSAPLLYGGSVKPENAGELANVSNVDGFLIGGASLEVASFLGILRACS